MAGRQRHVERLCQRRQHLDHRQRPRRELVTIGGGKENIGKVDYAVVGAKFAAKLKAAESLIDSSTEDGKRPAAWRQAKSDIYCALKAGHQLLKTPGIGQSALRTAKDKLVTAQNDAEDAKNNADHNAEHGINEVPDKKLEGDAAVGGVGDEKKVTSASKIEGGEVTVLVPDRKFKCPKLAAAMTALIIKAMDLEEMEGVNRKGKTGAQVAISACGSTTDTMDESMVAFQATMAALAKTG